MQSHPEVSATPVGATSANRKQLGRRDPSLVGVAALPANAAARQVPDPDDAAEQQRLRDQLAHELGADTLKSLYEEGRTLAPTDILDNLARATHP